MTTEHSTYTYEGGEQETVTLRRGSADPHGHALLQIVHSDGGTIDCYVDLAWLRDRADQLADTPRPLTPDAITDEMVLRAINAHMWEEYRQGPRTDLSGFREATVQAFRTSLAAALTEPPKRPEGAEDIEALIREAEKVGQGADDEALANYLAARLNVSPKENR